MVMKTRIIQQTGCLQRKMLNYSDVPESYYALSINYSLIIIPFELNLADVYIPILITLSSRTDAKLRVMMSMCVDFIYAASGVII